MTRNLLAVDLPKDLGPTKPTIAYNTFWKFAAERQEVFFRKLEGCAPPWTSDPVIRQYKFTNAYRAADRVSQFLIRHVIYEGEQDPTEIFFRVLLFKLLNKIETWRLLRTEVGELSYSMSTIRECDRVLKQAMARGTRIYSAAYIMPSGSSWMRGVHKHTAHLRLLSIMMDDQVPSRLTACRRMGQAFEVLRSYPMIGDFLAYQFVTDLNYSTLTDFSEMEFVMPGPGARDGIRKCFTDLGGLNEAEIIKLMTERQGYEFHRLGLSFRELWGRPLQLIDVQNLFCEVSKYTRIVHPELAGTTGRFRIKQTYKPNGDRFDYWFPPKWKLNEFVSREMGTSCK